MKPYKLNYKFLEPLLSKNKVEGIAMFLAQYFNFKGTIEFSATNTKALQSFCRRPLLK